MKVLYISYDGAMDPLGQSQVIPYLIGLSSRGARITLLSFEKPGRLSNKKGMQELMTRLRDNRIQWSFLRYHKNPTLLATLYDITIGLFKALHLLKRDNIDFIHVRSYAPAFIAYLLKRLKGAGYIFDMRGLWADERVDGGIWRKGSWLYWVTKRLEKILLLNSSSVVVLTHRVKEVIEDFDYMKDSGIRIDVIPTCVDLKRFEIQEKDQDIMDSLDIKNRFVLFYLGSIGTWYMLQEMIDFFKFARERIKNSFFLFLTNSEKITIENELKKNDLSPADYCIRSAGYPDVPRWLSVADASIFFIKPSFSKKSSCATKFGESLACGVPVIINPEIGDTDRVVRSNRIGVIIDGFNPDSYRRGVDELLDLRGEEVALRKRCRGTAEKILSLENGVSSFHGIYKDLA